MISSLLIQTVLLKCAKYSTSTETSKFLWGPFWARTWGSVVEKVSSNAGIIGIGGIIWKCSESYATLTNKFNTMKEMDKKLDENIRTSDAKFAAIINKSDATINRSDAKFDTINNRFIFAGHFIIAAPLTLCFLSTLQIDRQIALLKTPRSGGGAQEEEHA
jgi:hypothetical protein